jgi:hypothetical protein
VQLKNRDREIISRDGADSKDGKRSLLLGGHPWHEPVPVISFRSENIGLQRGLSLAFGKDQMQRTPSFRAASLSHASEQMQPEVMSR